MTTPYHPRFFAHELPRQHEPGDGDRLSMALFDAGIDVIPIKNDGPAVRVVEGTAPNGDRVRMLVRWRNIDQMGNDASKKRFEKQDYNTREMAYDVFYVNGDNNLENLRRPDQTWKVRLIEE
jgi:hypothetical protein